MPRKKKKNKTQKIYSELPQTFSPFPTSADSRQDLTRTALPASKKPRTQTKRQWSYTSFLTVLQIQVSLKP